MKIARRTCRGDECTDIEGMMKSVGGMKVAASRLARGMVSSANPGIYSKTYPEGSDPFDLSRYQQMIFGTLPDVRGVLWWMIMAR